MIDYLDSELSLDRRRVGYLLVLQSSFDAVDARYAAPVRELASGTKDKWRKTKLRLHMYQLPKRLLG